MLELLREILGDDIVVGDKGFFSARDETPIYYEVVGKGRPILFCYGLVCRREHWRHQLIHFYPNYQLITFDYRGHHRSGMPSNNRHLTIDWCASDVEDLIAHLKLKEVALMGHSLGVPVGAVVASRLPEMIKALVLICGSVSNPFEGMFYSDKMDTFFRYYAKLYETAPHLMSFLWGKFTDLNKLSIFLTSRLGFNPYLAEEKDVLGYMEGVNSIPLPVFYSILNDYTYFDGREGLKGILSPTLVIAGQDDCITPMELQEEMAKLIPKGELEKIPMGSHNAHMDLPDMVNQKIENFLQKIKYT